MILIALALSWHLRRTHEEISRAVTAGIARGQALIDLMPVLGMLDAEWKPASDDPTFRPSADTASRARLVVDQRFREGQLPGALHRDLKSIVARSEEAATSWDATNEAERRDTATRLSRTIQRMRREADRERVRNEQRLARALHDLEEDGDQASLVMLAVVYLVGIGSLVVAQRALARIIVPIERLSTAVDAVARGETDTRIPVAGDREIAHLGERFNEMTAALASSQSRLEALAHVDELTGLPNFRTFRRRFDEEMERSSRYETVFGLLVLDLDRFKKYNDTWGHHAGNEALQSVAATLRATVRAVDFPARFGGEEFAVITPETDAADLQILAERVRKAVAAIPPVEGRKPLTVSIGGAIFPADGANAEELFAVADRRLYEAKGAGRNRSVIES